jgi:hypothetical protein
MQKARLLLRVSYYRSKNYFSLLPRLKPPISFALRSTFIMFALLLILPVQPMTIPTATGGGLAFALLTQ